LPAKQGPGSDSDPPLTRCNDLTIAQTGIITISAGTSSSFPGETKSRQSK
jgi:hypothetical protein